MGPVEYTPAHSMERVFVTGGSGFLGRRLITALSENDTRVFALARSQRSSDAVAAVGAEPVRGDLSDMASLRQGMAGCDAVFHCAAHVEEWSPPSVHYDVNVGGTLNVIEAARAASVRTLVHVSTEAVLIGGPTLHHADEQWPYPSRPAGDYPRTKGLAEREVLRAESPALRTVVVRPRFIWGAGDTNVLPRLVNTVKAGRFMWIDQGRYPTSTTHVANVVEGLLLAAERGRSGNIYFVTDGEPVEFRAFVSALLETQGVEAPDKSIPGAVVRPLSSVVEGLWRILRLRSAPPVTKFTTRVIGEEVTVDDSKARRELGYVGRVTREEGLAELARVAQGTGALG